MTDLYREFADTWRFHEARIERRTIDALVGMAAGIAGDGIVTEAEALFLRNWMQENLQFMDDPVVNILYRRLRSMLADHCLDAEEAAELLEILRKFAGVIPSASQGVVRTGAPSSLPVDDPEPPIECSGKVFVFTGVMAYGPRKILSLIHI